MTGFEIFIGYKLKNKEGIWEIVKDKEQGTWKLKRTCFDDAETSFPSKESLREFLKENVEDIIVGIKKEEEVLIL